MRKPEAETARLQKRTREIRQEQRIATGNFVATELDLAITFCQVASSSTNHSKVRRNLENAVRARDSALHFLEKASPPSPAGSRIRRKLAELESLLRQLHQMDPNAG